MSAVIMNSNQQSLPVSSTTVPRSFLTWAKINTLATGILAIYALANVQTADAGIFSGLVTLGTCVGAGILFPTSLLWAAAPCYELTMLATANPLLP